MRLLTILWKSDNFNSHKLIIQCLDPILMSLRIAFICMEYFNYTNRKSETVPSNAHGGFGFLTRVKAEYLSRKGFDVHVLIPGINFKDNINNDLEINGVRVHTYQEKTNHSKITRTMRTLIGRNHNKYFEELLNKIKPDIIQSEDTPPLDILRNTSIQIPFLFVLQDPFDYYDVNLLLDSERDYLSIPITGKIGYELKTTDYHFRNKRITEAIHKSTFVKPVHKFLTKNKYLQVYAEAKFIAEKSKTLFSLPNTPYSLRNPIAVYDIEREKFDEPTICWVARWDPQKRPDMALLIAKQLPEVKFIMIGTANRNTAHYEVVEDYLKKTFSEMKNVSILGFVNEEEKREIIGKSWALLNTSIREGLPITFLEALAEETPIISYVDPDSYVSRFGIKVDYSLESFIHGIEQAVSERLFQKIGQNERSYALREHALDVVMNKHIQIYSDIRS